LKRNVFSQAEQIQARTALLKLRTKKFKQGLVHGDLCPRNVIYQDGKVVLLDWGSSKIDVVPHTEIGIVQMDNDLTAEEFSSFLLGLGIRKNEFKNIEEEITQINFLNSLDLYRWADENKIMEIERYISKLKGTFDRMMG